MSPFIDQLARRTKKKKTFLINFVFFSSVGSMARRQSIMIRYKTLPKRKVKAYVWHEERLGATCKKSILKIQIIVDNKRQSVSSCEV